ncbi:hypothetical protein PFLUV_G00182030 [Perca fluviatilis]|uniref:Uncharacterized protein n=1 Tax=Perca fluviatilis TaxID=8168 RepID=A0A6A5EZN3_PERFL|nr:hypothetical protein PFLUV_G00182030 [Perca fluviatilis]
MTLLIDFRLLKPKRTPQQNIRVKTKTSHLQIGGGQEQDRTRTLDTTPQTCQTPRPPPPRPPSPLLVPPSRLTWTNVWPRREPRAAKI